MMVIISVILGLGITHLLTGIVEHVQNRHRVRFSFLQLTWMLILFLLHILYWWQSYKVQNLGKDFTHFLAALAYPSLLYVTAGILVPKLPENESVDLVERFVANHRWFFGCCILGMVFLFLYRQLVWGYPWSELKVTYRTRENLLRLSGIALLMVMFLVGNRWILRLLTVVCVVALLAYFVLTATAWNL